MFTSRLYLGMHTVLDVVAGLALAILLMVPLVPLVDLTDHYFITESWALGLLIALSIATIVYYPCSDRWTPTRQVNSSVKYSGSRSMLLIGRYDIRFTEATLRWWYPLLQVYTSGHG